MITRFLYIFILRVNQSLERFCIFDFTMDTVLLIFTLISRPLIFISCLCTIIGAFISLYHWCQKCVSRSYIPSMATQTSQFPKTFSFDVSCHLEVVNEVSLHFFSTFSFPISIAIYQQWLQVFPKRNWIFLNNVLFTLKACSITLISL